MKLRILAASASVALLAAAGISAPAATAATSALIASANGVVGIAQTVEVRAPQFANQTIGLNFSLAGQVRSTANVSINAAGSGSTVWTPTDAGSWSVAGAGTFATATAGNLTVAAVPTTTTLYAANQAPTNAPTTLTAVVSATAGNSVPAGSVIFTTQFGSTLATVPLTANASGSATANYAWTPGFTTNGITITATYSPSAGVGGSANALMSFASDGIEVLAGTPTVSLKLPGSFTVGRSIDVGAIVAGVTGSDGSPIQGSVAFTSNVNGTVTGISGSVPLKGGQATATWTPSAAGNQVVAANFSASNSFVSGSANQTISVLPAPAADPISIGVQGGAAWPANGTVTVGANTSLLLFTTTGSGAPASISESGPCLVNGSTLITATSAATCTLTVSSPGTTAFGSNQATITINVQAPAKKKRR